MSNLEIWISRWLFASNYQEELNPIFLDMWREQFWDALEPIKIMSTTKTIPKSSFSSLCFMRMEMDLLE